MNKSYFPIIVLIFLVLALLTQLFWGFFAKYEDKKHVLPLITIMSLTGLGFIVYIFI